MNPRVQSVCPQNPFLLNLLFRNGERRVFDCSPLLDMPCMENLRDSEYFHKAFVRLGTVGWPDGEDICPDELYECSRILPTREDEDRYGESSLPSPAVAEPPEPCYTSDLPKQDNP